MVFDLKGKVALVTGGASGIGLAVAKELLKNEVKGVTLADINSNLGETELKEIEREFGPSRAIFVNTDTTNIQQFEDAFKKTVKTFKNVDILVNNAGILNEITWEKEVAVNVNGMIHGIFLGLEHYLQSNRQGPEAVIVNMASTAGLSRTGTFPIYSATKAAVVAMTRCWSDPVHYERSKVRLIAICPRATATNIITNLPGKSLGEPYAKLIEANGTGTSAQKPKYLAQEVIEIIKSGGRGTIWVIERNEAYNYIMPERETMRSNKRI